MRISYCTWGMMKMGIEQAIPGVAKIGYHAIELAVTPAWPTDLDTLDAAKRSTIKHLLKDNGLALSAVAGHTSMCEDDPAKNEANLKRLRDSLDLAVELATPGDPAILCSLIGGRMDEWDAKKELVAERVHSLGEYAASIGAIMAVEPHSGTSFDTPEKALWLMNKINHPNVRLNFDISHFDIIGIGIDECVPSIVPWSVHTHVKDQRGIYPNFEFLTPGSGPFNFVKYLAAMHKAGYTGFIGMEVSVMVQRKPGYDPLVDAALGYYALVHAFNESGAPLDR
jgi:sugar phosphate isomerase/epimerase